jgi:hypothetical protein
MLRYPLGSRRLRSGQDCTELPLRLLNLPLVLCDDVLLVVCLDRLSLRTPLRKSTLDELSTKRAQATPGRRSIAP